MVSRGPPFVPSQTETGNPIQSSCLQSCYCSTCLCTLSATGCRKRKQPILKPRSRKRKKCSSVATEREWSLLTKPAGFAVTAYGREIHLYLTTHLIIYHGKKGQQAPSLSRWLKMQTYAYGEGLLLLIHANNGLAHEHQHARSAKDAKRLLALTGCGYLN